MNFLGTAVGDLIKLTVGSVPPVVSIWKVVKKNGHAERSEAGAGPATFGNVKLQVVPPIGPLPQQADGFLPARF